MNSNSFTPIKNLNNSDSYIFQVEKNNIQDLKTASRSPSLEETEYPKNKISKKTLRGRKEKMPLPKDKLKCEICFEFSDFSKEDLISCSTCKCLFHKSCYDQFEIYENSSYKCIRCAYALQINKSIDDYNCFICGNSNGVLNINYATNCFYHKICVSLLNEFKDLNEKDICKENIRKWRYKNSCRYCGEKLSKFKAVIKCKNPKCKEYYHIPCAIEKGMIFDLNYMKNFYNISNNDEIPFLCSNHNKKISFMYKTYVMNNYSKDNDFQKNLINNDFIFDENEEQKTLFEQFEELSQKKEKNEEEKMNNNDELNNSKILSIIDEENVNDKKNEFFPLENENDKEKKMVKYNDINMDVDDSFENHNNNVFKLDFDKFIKNENDTKMNDCFYECEESHYHNYCCVNANLTGLNTCNELFIKRQNNFDSLPYKD